MQFRAEAGKTYTDSVGKQVSFTPEQLSNDAMGWLSEQYKENNPNINPATTNQPVAEPTTTPGILDASQGQAYSAETANYIKSLEENDIKASEIQKSELERQLADIERDYARRAQKAEESFTEQEATAGVSQFRLGQSGTPYQVAEKAKAAKAKLDYFNGLESEKQSKLSELKSAYEMNDLERVSALRGEIENIKLEERKFLETQRKNKIEEAKSLMEQTKFTQEQEDRTLGNVVPTLYANLTGDSVKDMETLSQYADNYGVDKTTLMSKIISYKTEQDKVNLLNSSSIANILGKTKAGGKINVPGLGNVEIVGQKEDAPSTLKAGGKVYNFQDGNWVDTGIKDSDLTPSNIIAALEKLGNTNALEEYLGMQGVQTGMRTDRHNNPTAMTTDVARTGGLIEGVDYVKGDAFPDNPNLFTAKLIGDPVEKTIKAIDNMGFKTQAGQNRWTYTDQIPGANNKEWQNLSYEQKENVIKEMYKREGGSGSIFGGGTDKFDQFTQEQIALSVLPVQTRNSEVELKRALEGIRNGLNQGLDPYEIADNLMGYKVNKPDEFSNNIRGYISQVEGLGGNSPAEFARMINAGNYSGVVNKLETAVLKGTKGKEQEGVATYSKEYGDRVYNLINENLSKLGIIKGNWNDKVRKKFVKTDEFQELSSSLAGLVSEWRHNMIGSAATENELKMIEDLIPKVSDNPFNALEKIKELQYMTLTSANSTRQSYNLPALNTQSLLNKNERVKLYGAKPALTVSFQGKTYSFPTEEAVNKFKSQLGIK